MKIPWKLTTIILLMAIPIVGSVVLFFRSAQREVTKAGNELQAVAYLEPLAALFVDVPQHRGTAAGLLSGDLSQRNRLSQLAGEIDQDLAALEALNPTLGSALDAVDRLASVQRGWRDLKQRTSGLDATVSFARHTQLIADIMELMQHVASQGQLIGDPETDSSFLIDTVVSQIPEVAENLGVLRGLGNGIAARGVLTLDERVRLSELVARVQTGANAINRNLAEIFRIRPMLEEQLGADLLSTTAGIQSFLTLVNQEMIRASQIDVVPTTYFAAGTQAIAGGIQLFDRSRAELQILLAQRQSDRRFERNTQLALAIGLSLLAALAAAYFSRGITRQVTGIGNLFGQIGIGDFDARAEVTSNDELGDMARNLNSMLDNTLTLIQSQAERDSIQQSIQTLLEEISGVADGDLRAEAEVTADVTGAIADSFNLMIGQLCGVISNVQETTLQVSSASSEIQATAEHLADGSENQAEQILNTSAAVEEMSVSIQQVSENAATASSVAVDALTTAKGGTQAVSRTIAEMGGIRQQVQETSKRIKRLGESSQEIGEIVQLIGDIADRTSILALNASIQAAMAGEAGRGFAVVAEEVERLADRSAEATKRIEDLIKTIQSETTEAVAAMDDTTRKVVDGSSVANDAGTALAEIESVSNRLAELIDSISMASKQQARGSESVSSSMTEISEVTQQTAAGTKQAAVSIHNLADLADQLRASVSTFRLPERMGGANA